MCGIVAVIAKSSLGLYKPEIDTFNNMLWMDTVRGKDSTGVFGVNRTTNAVTLLKEASVAQIMTEDPLFEQFLHDATNMAFVVGHNRAATRGSVVDDNAHPFRAGNVTLVHNGTLTEHKTMADVQVDSHAIAIALSAASDPMDVLPNINGAFALIWFDARENTLYACRNSQRPLYQVNCSDGTTVLSSEHMIAQTCLGRNNKYLSKEIPIEDIKPNTLYSWKQQTTGAPLTAEVPFPSKKVQATNTTAMVVHQNRSNVVLLDKKKTGKATTTKNTEKEQYTEGAIKSGMLIRFRVDDFQELAADAGKYAVYGSDLVSGVHTVVHVDEADLDGLMEFPMLRAEVVSLRYRKNELTTIRAKDPEGWFEVLDANGETTVTPMSFNDDLEKVHCSVCDARIAPSEIPDAELICKDGVVTTIVCGDCLHEFAESAEKVEVQECQ